MTAEEFWKSWLAFWLLAGPSLLGFVSIAYSQYLSHCHLDAIKEALKNSRYIYLWGPSLGKRGLIWSLLEISKISGWWCGHGHHFASVSWTQVILKTFHLILNVY